MNDLLKALARLNAARNAQADPLIIRDLLYRADWEATCTRNRTLNFAFDALVADAPEIHSAAA